MGSSAKKDIRRAKAESDRALKEGYDQAQGFNEQAYDLFNPLTQQATGDQNTYRQAIGLGTPDEQKVAQDRFFNDPAQSAILGQQTNALLRKYNAGGSGTGGGRLALAGARVGNEQYGNWLNRLGGLGDKAGAYTSQQAGIRQGQGETAWGYGATRAGSAINAGNAMAQSRSVGINNLLGIAGTAAKAFTAFSDIRLKRDIVRTGETPSGLPTYEFKYLWSDQPHHGVMAHEAATVFPDAVATDASGYLTVDYSKIG
jgi:hypothetical protein